jgi:hypothetical protein
MLHVVVNVIITAFVLIALCFYVHCGCRKCGGLSTQVRTSRFFHEGSVKGITKDGTGFSLDCMEYVKSRFCLQCGHERELKSWIEWCDE